MAAIPDSGGGLAPALIRCPGRARFEAAINLLTHAALDPVAKIPEFKHCAVRLRAGGSEPVHASFGGGQLLSIGA